MSEQGVSSSVAQRIMIKFLTTESVKPSDISRRLKTHFGGNTLKKTQVCAWHKQFLEGQTAVENEGHLRRPKISMTQENIFYRLVEGDRRLTVAEIALEVEISYGSAQVIITELLEETKLAYRRKRREFSIRRVILLHNNARPHTANEIKQKIKNLFWNTLEHPPSSPNLLPCDFIICLDHYRSTWRTNI